MIQLQVLVESLIYICIGLGIFALVLFVVSKIFPWSLQKELIEDENVALGIMFAGLFIAIAIIIAGAIQG